MPVTGSGSSEHGRSFDVPESPVERAERQVAGPPRAPPDQAVGEAGRRLAAARLPRRLDRLRLLRRAAADAHSRSDHDFAFLGDPGFDDAALRDALERTLGTEAVDLATGLCVQRGLGVPTTCRDAFERLVRDGSLDEDLGRRLGDAAGFRDLVAHAYEGIELARVHETARRGPEDLRAFLRIVRDLARPQ